MKRCLFFVVVLFSTFAFAQTKVMVQSSTASVHSEPSSTSEVLVTLKKGDRVVVAGVTETGWAKVKVTVSGFQFDGWVKKNVFLKPKTSTPKAHAQKVQPPQVAQSASQTPPSNMTSASNNQLEKFFEPSSPAKPTSTHETPNRSEEPKKTSTRASSSRSKQEKGDSWASGRLVLYGSPGFAIHQYTFGDATKDAFRYNLTGISATLGADYRLFDFSDDLIRINAQLQGQYVFFNTKTNLIDGTNTKFSDLTAKNKLLDAWFKVKLMLNFDRILSKPFLIGFSGGYQFTKFFGDDIVDDNGVPVGLYIDQTTKSIPVGLIAELLFLDPVSMTLGADVLIKNTASESPAGSSGSTPKAKMGFAPYFLLNFPIVGDTHFMGLRYQLRVQETKFVGPSSTRVNNVLNDATGTHIFHTLGLEYDYHF